MSESAFIVHVPEAAACVGELRKRFDASVHLGVPAHITILVPFMPQDEITPAVLARAQAALSRVGSFAFSLSKVDRFPTTAYLAPEPAAPFIALTEALVQEFPSFPPFRGEHASIIPHLTAATGNARVAEMAAAQLAATIAAHGPIQGHCSSVSLIENSSGLWREMHALSLPGKDG